MFTAVNRDLTDDVGRERLHTSAYTGGFDFQHQWAERTWTLTGFVSGSHVRRRPREALLRTGSAPPWRYFQRPGRGRTCRWTPAATALTGLSASEANLAYRGRAGTGGRAAVLGVDHAGLRGQRPRASSAAGGPDGRTQAAVQLRGEPPRTAASGSGT
jgi:hypothetical protein